MKLIYFQSTLRDYEEIHSTKMIKKIDWKGNEIGQEEIRLPQVIGKKEYRDEYWFSLDGSWKLKHQSARKLDTYFINDIVVDKDQFQKVIKELENE